jgi:hypothetical protein
MEPNSHPHMKYTKDTFATLPDDTKLELILNMHDGLSQERKDSWVLGPETTTTVWRNDIARNILKSAQEDSYDDIASKFLDNLSDEEVKKMVATILSYGTTTPPPLKKSKSGKNLCYSDIRRNLDASSKTDEENNSDAEDVYKNYGAKPLLTKETTDAEFVDGGSYFIAPIDKIDTDLGFNLAYVLMSILQYASGKKMNFDNLDIPVDVKNITVSTMTDQLTEYNVKFNEISKTYKEVLTGVEYMGNLILLVFNVNRHKEEKGVTRKTIPPTWIHFCLFSQTNKVLLTFNETNTNYKLGKISKIKNEEEFQKYSDGELNKKIVPVARKEDERNRYECKRDMNFCKAFVIEKK